MPPEPTGAASQAAGPLVRWWVSSARLAGALAVACLALARPAGALAPDRALTQYRVRGWGVEEGLPVAGVNTLVQTPDGYLWAGAEEGLSRFDGVRFTVYDQASRPPLDNRVVMVLAADPGGGLLVGGTAGVSRRTEEGFAALAPGTDLGQATVYSLCSDRAGDLWVGTNQRLRCFRAGREINQAATAALPAGLYRAAAGAGELWAASDRAVYAWRGGVFETVLTLDGAQGVPALCPGAGGGVWIGARDGTGRWKDGRLETVPALDGVRAQCLCEDRAGCLWIGTIGKGLYRWNPARGKLEHYTEADGLRNNIVTALLEDREGSLWVGTNGGLQAFTEGRFVMYGRPEGLADDVVHAVFRDEQARLWIGTNAGLSVLDRPGEPPTNYPLAGEASSLVMSLGSGAGAGGGLLVGAYAGLRRWREGRFEAAGTGVPDLESRRVYAVCPDRAGGVWVACYSGVYRLRGGGADAQVRAADGLPGKAANVLLVDHAGALWMGTDSGLTRRDPAGRLTEYGPAQGLAGSYVTSLLEDAGGDLFIGTIGGGLSRLRAGKITRYTTRQGLFDDTTFSLLEDAAGRLWLGGNKGVWNLAKADLDRLDRHEIAAVPCTAYGVADGLRSRECNGGSQPCAWRDADGTLWWATAKGLASLRPGPAGGGPPPPAPPVRVEEVAAGAGAVRRLADGVAELAAGTRKFEVAYTALCLAAPEAVRFRYRLDGFDRDWNPAGGQRIAHYTNLPPGRYTFRVQAATGEGGWTGAGAASLALVLRPRWDQTAAFRALEAAALLGAVGALVWALRRRLALRLVRAEAQNRERARTEEILRRANAEATRARAGAEAAQVQAETARLEAEMAWRETERASRAKSDFLSRVSHELRTPLNAILGFGQLLELEELPARAGESVERILGGGRHLLGVVNEVLDLANLERGAADLQSEPVDPAAALGEAARQLAPLARERGVALRVEASPYSGPPVQADAQRLHQILLHLLGNAIQYNRPDGGEAVAWVADAPAEPGRPACVRLGVRDTGPGIAPGDLERIFTPFERLEPAYGPVRGTGLGLALSRQLAEAMGGRVGVESAPGAGSTFWVELPVAVEP